MTKREGKQLEYIEVVLRLEPDLFMDWDEYHNHQPVLLFSSKFISTVELDARELENKLPILTKALDLRGKVSVFIRKGWEDEEED